MIIEFVWDDVYYKGGSVQLGENMGSLKYLKIHFHLLIYAIIIIMKILPK